MPGPQKKNNNSLAYMRGDKKVKVKLDDRGRPLRGYDLLKKMKKQTKQLSISIDEDVFNALSDEDIIINIKHTHGSFSQYVSYLIAKDLEILKK